MGLFTPKPKKTYGPQPGHYNGCVGCSRWAKTVDETCSVDGCNLTAQRALMSYVCTSPGIGARSWFFLCPEHGRALAKELLINVGGDGPFDQDIRLRMFTPETT